MKEIPVGSKGLVALVDDANFDYLAQFKWRANRKSKGLTYYAYRDISYKTKFTRHRVLTMHREIMNAPDHMHIDHVNRNGLDNRKTNLRYATQAQNSANRAPYIGTSEYKGVSWDKKQDKWVVQTIYQGIKYHLGAFSQEEDAARAYDKRAKELFGEFAYLNFPEDWL